MKRGEHSRRLLPFFFTASFLSCSSRRSPRRNRDCGCRPSFFFKSRSSQAAQPRWLSPPTCVARLMRLGARNTCLHRRVAHPTHGVGFCRVATPRRKRANATRNMGGHETPEWRPSKPEQKRKFFERGGGAFSNHACPPAFGSSTPRRLKSVVTIDGCVGGASTLL